ncbi:MAG: hypothetical protein JWM85_3637 [Acidimicrobiaceae bacterium]|nr:hypothetical protein [Acidimicrobiaceae bacterium]
MGQQPTPSAQMQTPSVNAPASRVPFRAATIERVALLASESLTLSSTTTQRIERTVEGAGFIFGVVLDVVFTGATSTAASVAAYTEDAPFNALDTVILRDVNGELSDLSGWNTWLCNLLENWSGGAPASGNAPGNALPSAAGVGGVGVTASQDGNINLNIGSVGTASTTSAAGGNFRFQVRVPVGTNRRDLLGILGNQDRAQKYSLRSDLAISSAIFSTSPSSLPAVAINKFYENYAVPLPTAPDGSPQEVFPPTFGTLHFHTSTVSEAAPANGSTVNHYIRRLGNTTRYFALVFRSATSSITSPIRGNADANPPTLIRVKLGEDTVLEETWTYRRWIMFERYKYDLPRGVAAYDFIHDFGPFAGFEVGDDYVHSQALVNGQFMVTYPATGSTWQVGSTLTIVTSDLIYSEPQVASVR